MNMEELLKKRHSVRKYKKAVISESEVEEVLKLGCKAPTAGGLRAYQAIAVYESSGRIAKIARQNWIAQASLVLVLCTWPERSAKKYGDRGKILYCIQDATLYGLYLDLIFVSRGYGTCWVGAFGKRELREFLEIPNHLNPMSLLVVGVERINE